MTSKKDLSACFLSLEVLIAWRWDGHFVVKKDESVVMRLNGQMSERKICLQGSEKTVIKEYDLIIW